VWETGQVHTESWWGYLRERDHLRDLGINGSIIFIRFKNWVGRMDYISLAGERGFVNAVMNLQFPYNAGNSTTE
jgi:hypothetical protein